MAELYSFLNMPLTCLNSLEEFWLSMTMFITLKLVVEDHNDYNFFSYYGQVVTDI
jgi:hypothetical protein